MKIKSIFATALAALTVVSCSKSNNGETPAPDSGEATTMGLVISVPAGTKAPQADGSDVNATSEESKIKTLNIYVFNPDGTSAFRGAEDGARTIGTDFTYDSGLDAYVLNEASAIKTTTGAKKIYVGANLPAAFQLAANANESALSAAVAFTMAEMTTADEFAMFSDVVIETLIAQDAQGNSVTNEVGVTVQRMVSKVAVQTEATDNKFTTSFPATEASLSVEYEIKEFAAGQSATSMYTKQMKAGNKLVTPGVVGGFDATAKFPVSNSSVLVKDVSSTYVGDNASANNLYGEVTYVLVQAQATPNKQASVNAGNIEWNPASFTSGTFWVVRYNNGTDDEVYFCASETDADAVGNELGTGATKQKYDKGYTYFMVLLNEDKAAQPFAIYRNQFVHVNITGVADDAFGGQPGDPTDGEKFPPNPIDPGNPDNPGPTDPIIETDATLVVNVEVDEWKYAGNDVELK